MKNTFITLVFLLICSTIFLQEKPQKDAYITTWGSTSRLSGDIVEIHPSGALDFLAVREIAPRITSHTRHFLETFKNLDHQKSEEVIITTSRSINTVLALNKFNKNALSLTRSENNENTMSLFFDAFSTADLSRSGESILLDKFEANQNLKNFNGWISTNKSDKQIGVFYEFPLENNNLSGLGFCIFDSNFEIVKKDQVIFDQPKEDFFISDIKLTTNGNFFIVTHQYDYKKEVRNPKPTTIYKFDGAELLEYNLKLQDYNLRDIKVEVQHNNFVLSGLISRQNAKNRSGAYAIRIDSRTGRVMTETIFEFEEEALRNVRGSFNAEDHYFFRRVDRDKVDYSLEDLRLNDMFISENNEIFGVVEQQNEAVYFKKRLIQPKYKTKYKEKLYFNNNNILVYKIGSDGLLKWETVIEKRQRSKEDESIYLSIAANLQDDFLYLIHNDDKRNYDEGGIHKNKNQLWSANSMDFRRCLSVCKVDVKTGEFIRYKLNNEHVSRFPLSPSLSCNSGSENGVILHSRKGRRNLFGEIVFISE